MAFRCKSCDRELPETPDPGTPCPTCGAELVPEAPLEVDAAWAADKARKQAAAAAPASRKKGGSAGVILAVVLVVMVGVLVVMVMQRQPTARGADLPDGVELTIQAPRPVPITIDGVKAGKTPQSIRLKGRTRPMRIEGGGVSVTITPDRDQTINLVK